MAWFVVHVEFGPNLQEVVVRWYRCQLGKFDFSFSITLSELVF